MKDYKIIAQLFTVRDLLKDKSDDEIQNVLAQIKEMGYEGVQVSGIGQITDEIANLYYNICNELELDISATHTSLDALEQDLDFIIKYHKLWNCKYVGIGSMPGELHNYEGVLDFADRCNKIGKKLKDEGITLVYHNHRFEFEKHEGKTWMDTLYETFDPEFVEFEIDVYWIQSGGENPVEWIYKVDGRMAVIHFKDFRIVKDEQQFAEVGKGNLNWDLISEACEKTGVKYAAVEQDCFTNDPLNSLKISIEFLKKRNMG